MSEFLNAFEGSGLVLKESARALRHELDIFQLPSTSYGVYHSESQACHPLYPLSDSNAPIEYQISTGGNTYLDLYSSYLIIQLRVLKADGGNIPVTEKVSMENLGFHTLFSNVETYLNDVLISDSNNYYSYVAVIDRLLKATSVEQSSSLQMEGFYPNIVPDNYNNDSGFVKRFNDCKGSKIFSYGGRLVTPLTEQRKYLVPGSSVRFVLKRSPPEIALNSAVAYTTTFPYKIEIMKATFFACKKVILNDIMQLHKKQLESGRQIVYSTNDLFAKSYVIPAGFQSFDVDNVTVGKLPQYIILCMVTAEALLGKLDKSAFKFEDFGLQECSLQVNGATIQQTTIPFSFEADGKGVDEYLLGLNGVMSVCENQALGNGISLPNFKQG